MKLRHSVVTILMTTMTAIAIASPAGAQDMYMSKTSGRTASVDWTQFDGEPTGSPFGNVHIGNLYLYETTSGVGDAFVWIEDYECPVGVHPWEDYEGVCTYKGFRQGWAYGVDFTIDKKLTSARMSGNLEMVAYAPDESDPHGGSVGGPTVVVPANVTWSGFGDLARSRSSYRWSDGTSSYSGQYSSTNRSATVGGTIGAMGFDPASSSGWLSNFKDMSKGRSK